MLLFACMAPDILQKRQRSETWRARLSSSSETQCLPKTRNILAARIFSREHHWKEGSGHCYFMSITCQTSTSHSCISSALLPKSTHLWEVIQNPLCHWKKKKKSKINELQRLPLFTSALATGAPSRVRDAGLGCQQHPSPSCDSAPHSANTECCPAVHFSRKKKKKKKDCVCNSCEGLSVCIVLSRAARIKYALKCRIGVIDCISLLMSHPRQGLQCAGLHINTWSLLQNACHQSAGGSKWEPAWFSSLTVPPNNMLLKANSEDGPGNWNPSRQGPTPVTSQERFGKKRESQGGKTSPSWGSLS